VDGEGTRARSGSKPAADGLSFEHQRAAGAGLVRRPLAAGLERTMSDTDSREVEDCTELEGEAGAARVVATGRIHEQDVRWLRESAHGGLEQGTLPESK
jgi:hypothetical protein